MLRSFVICLLLCIRSLLHVHAQISIEGRYQGTNLYIQNPFADDGGGFCSDSVTINHKPYHGVIHASAFELKFDSLGLQIGDSLSIVIYHKKGCKPKVLQSFHGTNRSTKVKFGDLTLSESGTLKWTATAKSKVFFTIEQFRWNKWVAIGEVWSEIGEHEYEQTLGCSIHSGENIFRIKVQNSMGLLEHSIELHNDPNKEKITYSFNNKANIIQFSACTRYELYNSNGGIINKGLGEIVFLDKLKDKKYYVNYDNKTVIVNLKKKPR